MKTSLKVVFFTLLLSFTLIKCDNETVQPDNQIINDSILINETVDYIYIEYLDSLIVCKHDTMNIDINNDKINDFRFVIREYVEGDLVERSSFLTSLSDSIIVSIGDTGDWVNIRYVEEGETLNEEWVVWRPSLLVYSFSSFNNGSVGGSWGSSGKTNGYIVIKKLIIEGSQSYGWIKMAASDTSFTVYETLIYKKPTPFIYVGDTTKWIP